MIAKLDSFHGCALVRLVQDKQTWGIKLYSGNNSYLINDSTCIYIKYSEKRLSPWRFTFSPEHVKTIKQIRENVLNAYVILICNEDGICCLDFEEFSRLIFVGDFDKTKWISVYRDPREKYTVLGSDGRLKYKIGDSDFPKKIFLQRAISNA